MRLQEAPRQREATPESVTEVARRLTKAQRAALLTARETVLLDRMKCTGRNQSLRRLSLTVAAWRGGDLLTPLGLAVRALLQKDTPDVT